MSDISRDKEQALPAGGTSGKKVTLGVLAGLLIVGGWLSYCLWCYQKLDDARAESTVAWRALAEKLLVRYSVAERQVATGADDQTLELALAERFRLALERFRTTSQSSAQQGASQEIEALLSELELGEVPTGPLKDTLDAFNSSATAEAAVLSQAGNQFLGLFMKFQQPFPLELTE